MYSDQKLVGNQIFSEPKAFQAVLTHVVSHDFHVPCFGTQHEQLVFHAPPCLIVAVRAPRWRWGLFGGSEGSLVAVRAPRWWWGLPGGSEGPLMMVKTPTQIHGHAESETAVLFCVCEVFCSYGRKHHGFITKTHPLHISCYHFPSASVRFISLE